MPVLSGTPIRAENLAYLEEAIVQVAESGAPWAQAEIERLEGSRQEISDQIAQRDEWVEDHADLLYTYTAINDELTARETALAVGYQLNTPDDALETLGPRPANTTRAREWDEAVIHHAAARIRLGPDTDLTDSAVLTAASWQTALRSYHPQLELERVPTLRLTG